MKRFIYIGVNFNFTATYQQLQEQYIGCFENEKVERDVKGSSLTLTTILTVELCIDKCRHLQFTYAAVQVLSYVATVLPASICHIVTIFKIIFYVERIPMRAFTSFENLILYGLLSSFSNDTWWQNRNIQELRNRLLIVSVNVCTDPNYYYYYNGFKVRKLFQV